MKISKMVLPLLLLLIIVVGCTPATIDTPDIDQPGDSLQTEDVAYGIHPRQRFDIAWPASASTTNRVPVVLFIHGGGWTTGDKSNFSHMRRITDAGYAYVSMNYRLVPEATYVEMLADITSVLNYLKSKTNYPIRNDRVAVVGSSAGAHLALLYSYSVDSPIDIAFVVSMVGPTDFLDPAFRTADRLHEFQLLNLLTGTSVTQEQAQQPGFVFPEAWSAASPIAHVDAQVPPSLLAYGQLDDIVPYSNGQRLDAALISVGVAHQFITFPNSGHDLANDSEQTTQLLNSVLNYLTAYLPR